MASKNSVTQLFGRNDKRLEILAIKVARKAHKGQVDKHGEDYIWHPARVAARLQSVESRAVGWLHDVIEDSKITAHDLLEMGFPSRIVTAVTLLTRTKEVSSDDYYRKIVQNKLAREVKLADVADNSDPARLVKLDEKTKSRLERKYAHALEMLNSGPNELIY